MGIIDKCGVRGDATLCVVIFNEDVRVLDFSDLSALGFYCSHSLLKDNSHF